MKRKDIASLSVLSVVVVSAGITYLWRIATRREVERLAAILEWRDGAAVADVGAGTGAFAIAAARRVGEAGQVFATDIEKKKLNRIRKRASKRGLENLAVLEADQEQSGLPPDRCDAILLRGSYHHFTNPAAMTANLHQALRPGGMLAVIEFPPRRWLSLIAPVRGVPVNRGGHGIPPQVLIQEFTDAGFELHETIPQWVLDTYCVVFRKPAHA